MSEKLTDSITFKCTYEEKELFKKRAKACKQPLSVKAREILREWLFPKFEKQVSIKEISVIEEQLNSLITHISLATDTSDTFRLEHSPRPIRDVTPKLQAQKKPNCCNQLSIFAIHQQCEE